VRLLDPGGEPAALWSERTESSYLKEDARMATGTSMSAWLETQLLNGTLRNTAYTPAVTVYLGLFTTNPGEGDASGVPSGTEVTGNAYARQSVAFGVPTGGATNTSSNTGTITFPTATGSWGTIGFVAIFDALTSGHMLYYGALTASHVINNGNTFTMQIGDLSVQLD
jgi:hypothetical protein